MNNTAESATANIKPKEHRRSALSDRRRRDKYERIKKQLAGAEDNADAEIKPAAMTTAKLIEQTALHLGAALVGALVGAVLGKFSLLGAVAATGYGVYTRNTYIMVAGLGIALGHNSSSKSLEAEKQDGYFSLSAAGKRIENFTGSLLEKFTFSSPKTETTPVTPVPATVLLQQQVNGFQELSSTISQPMEQESGSLENHYHKQTQQGDIQHEPEKYWPTTFKDRSTNMLQQQKPVAIKPSPEVKFGDEDKLAYMNI